MMSWSPRCYIPSFMEIGLPVPEKIMIFKGFYHICTVQWLARLPGTQEIRGSSPGRMPVSCNTSNLLKILNSDTVEHL